jgi:hypothetical protein
MPTFGTTRLLCADGRPQNADQHPFEAFHIMLKAIGCVLLHLDPYLFEGCYPHLSLPKPTLFMFCLKKNYFEWFRFFS